MVLKRKVQNPPKDAKQVKKGCQGKMEGTSSFKEDDKTEKISKGESNCSDRDEKKIFSPVKMEALSPELLKENQSNKKPEGPSLELNNLLQKRSKLSLQGSTSWKVFLFLLL